MLDDDLTFELRFKKSSSYQNVADSNSNNLSPDRKLMDLGAGMSGS